MSSASRPTLAASPSQAPPSFKSKRRSCARKFERFCCNCIIYFPLVFVYGLTTWAVGVQASVGFAPFQSLWVGRTSAIIGILLFILLNWSYTTAVFTDPGSPLTQTTSAYSIVPSADEEDQAVGPATNSIEPSSSSLTVKSTGEARYCKKCHTSKPDRTHHCSTCRRCVLKMDHHCPWLATCVGFRNYKPFLLFLLYTCIFCLLCFFVSASWVWSELFGDEGGGLVETERLMPVNVIILAVMAGIIGLVLSGFTGWHVYLACTGQTTIESLEKTRYLGPLRKSLQRQQQQQHHFSSNRPESNTPGEPAQEPRPGFAAQLREIHANAIPGVTRPEEGVPSPNPEQMFQGNTSNTSPAHSSLRKNLSGASLQPPHVQPPPYHPANEAIQERARYNAYLDELDTAKLPNAFNLGWRRNLTHVFGPRPELWGLPICNTTGDGWNWEPSNRWLEARENLARERKARQREEEAFARERWETMHGHGGAHPGASYGQNPNQNYGPGHAPGHNGIGHAPHPPPRRYHGRMNGMRADPNIEPSNDDADAREIDDTNTQFNQPRASPSPQRMVWGREAPVSNWNDIPEEYLAPTERSSSRAASHDAR